MIPKRKRHAVFMRSPVGKAQQPKSCLMRKNAFTVCILEDKELIFPYFRQYIDAPRRSNKEKLVGHLLQAISWYTRFAHHRRGYGTVMSTGQCQNRFSVIHTYTLKIILHLSAFVYSAIHLKNASASIILLAPRSHSHEYPGVSPPAAGSGDGMEHGQYA